MGPTKTQIHGYRVIYDESTRAAVEHLRSDLQYKEAKTIFDAARINGSAEFEDDEDRDWTLLYNRGDYSYTLTRRTRE